MMKQRLAILGSTGSIGVQTLDVVRDNPERFEVTTLTSNTNWELLARQAREFDPDSVVIADKRYYDDLRNALADTDIKIYAGSDSVAQVVMGEGVDTVVNAIVGYAGLTPSLRAVESGKKLALANKESLVVAGDLVMKRAMESRSPIIPVDSEHSAIFQSLVGEVSPIERLILTASGGPFLDTPAGELANVTREQALRHPRWEMGSKITIDSATLMNKGFEVIEAYWLFGTGLDKIEVLVHPQSVVHSMVEFADGAIKAQLGTPDMHLPIQYALTFPERVSINAKKFNFAENPQLTFLKPDHDKFPLLGLAYEAVRRGGNTACVLNAANEVAVAAFLEGRIGFTDIYKTIIKTVEKADFVSRPSEDDYRLTDEQARGIALSLII